MNLRSTLSAAALAAASLASAQTLYVSCGASVDTVSPGGSVATFATGFGSAEGLAFDGSGNLYVADQAGGPNLLGAIDEVTPSGSVSTYAVPAYDSGAVAPIGLAFGKLGSLWVTTARGLTEVEAGQFGKGSAPGDAGLAYSSSVGSIGNGTFYAADPGSGKIVSYEQGGNPATFASGLPDPFGLAFDASGNLFVSTDSGIDEITPGGAVSTFVSGLSNAQGLAFDPSGNLYVALYGDGVHGAGSIDEITPGGSISTYASGLTEPEFLAFGPTPAPEPLTIFGLGVPGLALVVRRMNAKAPK